MASYLITGCSRGIGLDMVKQLSARPSSAVATIFATTRAPTPPQPLADLIQADSKRIHFVQLDTDDRASIEAAASNIEQQLGQSGLDILVNNAGIAPWESDPPLGMDSLEQALKTNVVGVRDIITAFLQLLRKGQQKKIINVSSTMGSMALAELVASVPRPSYKISKAALNMLTVQYSIYLRDEGFTTVAISPGWLKTDLGGKEYADLEVDVGVKATLELIDRLKQEDTGKFLNIHIPGNPTYDGEALYPSW
ncbi:uncharacterized protein HMPREF1541_01696 [Cyphellophora europaea CBS 101466]|uniref:NAD(P)-binding protein n=1 Tax=Cyphellophora europaea (strain CBS 101466) TaxID=1220924 RepID=W2S3M1_CYPE1|nr:uncharacterized protein HMPREF1541_01696 [Cyphellophora europaea CBS 101466]ETN42539.1 hypothetical protein HMPREF1541_01696 [Cyphellophora europaea CBS 101466]